jgi:anthranilate phosphoribosyltransferase
VLGGSPQDNAAIVRAIFAGEPGPRRDIAVLNAGAAIYVSGIVETLEQGVRSAEAAIDDGRAAAALEALASLTRELAPV